MRSVAHWDGDRFFASVEQAADRRLRGKPVVVGGEKRGVVLSASSEARRLGIRPGWPTQRARRAVPALVVVPAHFELYERFFDEILGLCRETTPLVEPSEVGAAWLDLTGAERVNGRDAGAVMAGIQKTVREWLRVSISSGIATNKVVARLAARVAKPAGRMTVAAGEERKFLAPLPLRALPGLERRALAELEVAGLRTLGQFAAAPLDALVTVLGRGALPLQRRAQGVSEEPVGKKRATEPGWVEKIEFEEDVWEEEFLLATLRRMLERVMAQVRVSGVEVRRLVLGIRYTDREEARRTVDLAEPTALEAETAHLLPEMLKGTWTRRVRLRALELRAGRVYRPSAQMDLFAPVQEKREQWMKLAGVIDGLRRRHGAGIVLRCEELEKKTA